MNSTVSEYALFELHWYRNILKSQVILKYEILRGSLLLYNCILKCNDYYLLQRTLAAQNAGPDVDDARHRRDVRRAKLPAQTRPPHIPSANTRAFRRVRYCPRKLTNSRHLKKKILAMV